MAGDDGTATPSQAPTTISPTHIEETIFKIVEVTDAPSYAPTLPRPTYAPTTPAPSFTYTMQAGQCYDKVWLEHTQPYDPRCEENCARIEIDDCARYCDGAGVVTMASNDRGGLDACTCATASKESCMVVGGYDEPFSLARAARRYPFDGTCVLGDTDLQLTRFCDQMGKFEPDEYRPTRRPTTFQPTARREVEVKAELTLVGRRGAILIGTCFALAAFLLFCLLFSRWRERRRLKRIAEMSSSAADFTSDFSPLDDDGQKWLEMM